MEKFTDKEALDYHSQGKPGKIEIIASKPMTTQRDLALAYSPGVAVPVEAIAKDKMTDLNAFTVESAMKMVAGTARSMGITVSGTAPWSN